MSLIYNFKEHGLYFDKEDDGVPKVYISINTLELIFDLTTGTLIGVQGFLPLVRALISKIDLPDVIEKAYRLTKDDLKECKCNEVYEFSDLKPEIQKNFENVPIKFDNEKGIILIGQNLNEGELGIRINKNVICGVDQKDILRCLYIIPDRFILAS